MPSKRTEASRGNVNLGHLRVANQRILGSSLAGPAEVVRWMLAMQAQDFAGAKWSVALRTGTGTDAEVERALASGAIVRSWPMRGTLHFTAGEDLGWMLSLTTPRLVSGAASRRANLDLDEATLERARTIAVSTLMGGKWQTREQLLAELDRRGVSTAGQRGYHILWHLSQTGTLCFGPPQGKAQTFVLLDEWVKRPRRLERDEALGEFARRYFTSHGPATLKDFGGWTKLTAADVKTGLAVARPELRELLLDGVSYWMAANAEEILAALAPPPSHSVLLLPGFDEYILGYQDRRAVLAPEYAERIVPGGNGMFMATIVVGGVVVGTWRRQTTAKEVRITLEPFTTSPPLHGVADAVERYGQFLGLAARLETGPSTPARQSPASRAPSKTLRK